MSGGMGVSRGRDVAVAAALMTGVGGGKTMAGKGADGVIKTGLTPQPSRQSHRMSPFNHLYLIGFILIY